MNQRFDAWNEKLAKEDIWEFKTNPWQHERFSRVVELVPDGKLLDLGCMEGEFTKLLPNKDITGVDLSSVAIERAKLKIPNAKFEVLDIEESKLEEQFDVIVCMETLYYLTDVNKAKENILSMLRAGGTLVLEHVLNSVHANKVIADDYHRFFEQDERLKLITRFISYGDTGSNSYEILVLKKI